MKRLMFVPLFVALAACPADKQERARSLPIDSTRPESSVAVVDTSGGDLASVKVAVPTASPDTFHEQRLTDRARARAAAARQASHVSVPEAPPALLAAVEREQAFSRFCYVEFGVKQDPSLRGNVAMVVTVGNEGVSDARVGDSNWSGSSGAAVDRCLNERAIRAWKVAPGAVPSGRYAIHLSFTGG